LPTLACPARLDRLSNHQVILIDSAYCVNEFLVEKGYAQAARPGTEEAWNMYLVACLCLSFGLFAAAMTGEEGREAGRQPPAPRGYHLGRPLVPQGHF